MAKMKDKNLHRFVALYIAGNMAFGGVAYAEEGYQEHYLAGAATVIDDAAYLGDGVIGGSHNASVDTSDIKVNSNGKADEVFGGGKADAGANAQANVNQATIKINGGQIADLFAGGHAINGGTANITGKSTIEITDGTIENVTGGGSAQSGHVAVKEFVVTINGGTIGFIQGGGDAKGDNATANVDKTTITINDGTIGLGSDQTLGGGWATVGTAVGVNNASNAGDVTFNINNGTFRNNIYGGGISSAEDEDATVPGLGTASAHVNNVNMNISGGTIEADVYAGGATLVGMNAGADRVTSTVDKAMLNISGGKIKGSVYAGGMNTATVGNSSINISGGEVAGDVSGVNATKSVLNFTAGTGSTIGGTVAGFEAVTVATGAKTNWQGDKTHSFGSLTVADGGVITVGGQNVTFDFAPVSSASLYSRMARDVANGNFNVNGEVNLAQGTTLTMQNGTITTAGKGAFISAVDKDNVANSGKVQWGTGAKVEGDLHFGFANITSAELADMGKTDEFSNLLQTVADTNNLLAEQSITNAEGGLTAFTTKKTASGLIVTEAPHTSERGIAYYTGVRKGNAYINHNIVDTIHEHTAGLRNGERTNEFWAGIRGGATDVETRFGEAEVKTQYYQLGYDWNAATDRQKAAVGLYITKIAGDSTQNDFKNDLGSAYDFGIYGTKEFSGGNYVSLIGRYGQIGNSLRTDVQTTTWKDKGYGLSVEFGNRSTQANGLMLEPYIQFNYNRYSAVDFSVGADKVGMDSSAMLDGKLGLRLIKQAGDNPNNTISGGIAYTRGLSGDFSLQDQMNGEKLGGVDHDANAIELSVGMNRQLSSSSTLNLQAKKEFGDYKGWSVEGMVNVAF